MERGFGTEITWENSVYGNPASGATTERFQYSRNVIIPYVEARLTKILPEGYYDAETDDTAQDILDHDMQLMGKVNSEVWPDDTSADGVGTYAWPPETVLFAGPESEVFEQSNEGSTNAAVVDGETTSPVTQGDYTRLWEVNRVTYVFYIMQHYLKDSPSDTGPPLPVTWNMAWRPMKLDQRGNGAVKTDDNGFPQFDDDYPGVWGTLDPHLYETADFDELFTAGD